MWNWNKIQDCSSQKAFQEKRTFLMSNIINNVWWMITTHWLFAFDNWTLQAHVHCMALEHGSKQKRWELGNIWQLTSASSDQESTSLQSWQSHIHSVTLSRCKSVWMLIVPVAYWMVLSQVHLHFWCVIVGSSKSAESNIPFFKDIGENRQLLNIIQES